MCRRGGTDPSEPPYLSVTDLEGSGVQLFESGVVGGHQDPVLSPQDGGSRGTCGLASEDHRPVHGHRLVGGTLADDGWRSVRDHWRRDNGEIKSL